MAIMDQILSKLQTPHSFPPSPPLPHPPPPSLSTVSLQPFQFRESSSASPNTSLLSLNPIRLFPLTSRRTSNQKERFTDAATPLSDLQPRRESSMEPAGPSGHRRRRSSLMKDIDTTNPSTSRPTRSPTKAHPDSIVEETSPKIRKLDEDARSTSDEFELTDLSEDEDDDLHIDEETGLTGRERNKRRKRRRRNTLLDQRVAPEIKLSPEERSEANHNVVKHSLVNGLLICLWYFFSLAISIYNKWMFDPEYLDFHFPLFTTSLHMIVQFSLASLVLFLFPRFRPQQATISKPNDTLTDPDAGRLQEEFKKPLMTKTFYITRIGPCGIATGLDIGLGNMAMQRITLTFYTMCKSSALAFVLIFAFVFQLESPSWRLVSIIATMTIGVVMMVAGEVDFRLVGFILIISASFFSGFRWALTQILLLRNPATSNPFASIFFLTPVMFLSLVTIAIPVEGFPTFLTGLHGLMEKKGNVLGPLLLLFPGAIAFCMTSSEFALLQRTSVVTLSIAGIFKEVVTIIVAGIIFHDHLTPINISGLFVTLGAIGAYNYIKIKKMQEEAGAGAHLHHAVPTSSSDVDSDESGSDEDDEDSDEERDIPHKPKPTTSTHMDAETSPLITSDGEFLPNPDQFLTNPKPPSQGHSRAQSLGHGRGPSLSGYSDKGTVGAAIQKDLDG